VALSLIPIPKNSILLPLMGIPFERALRFHRRLGQVAVHTSVLHGAAFLVDWFVHPRDEKTGMENMLFECGLTAPGPFCDRSTAEEAERCDASYEEGGVNEHTCKPHTIRAHEAPPGSQKASATAVRAQGCSTATRSGFRCVQQRARADTLPMLTAVVAADRTSWA